MDQGKLADRLRYYTMTHREALAIAGELRATADRLEREQAGVKGKRWGAGWNGRWDEGREEWVWEYSTFEEALASIREAARWYEKVGTLGFGVEVWYY